MAAQTCTSEHCAVCVLFQNQIDISRGFLDKYVYKEEGGGVKMQKFYTIDSIYGKIR